MLSTRSIFVAVVGKVSSGLCLTDARLSTARLDLLVDVWLTDKSSESDCSDSSGKIFQKQMESVVLRLLLSRPLHPYPPYLEHRMPSLPHAAIAERAQLIRFTGTRRTSRTRRAKQAECTDRPSGWLSDASFLLFCQGLGCLLHSFWPAGPIKYTHPLLPQSRHFFLIFDVHLDHQITCHLSISSNHLSRQRH